MYIITYSYWTNICYFLLTFIDGLSFQQYPAMADDRSHFHVKFVVFFCSLETGAVISISRNVGKSFFNPLHGFCTLLFFCSMIYLETWRTFLVVERVLEFSGTRPEPEFLGLPELNFCWSHKYIPDTRPYEIKHKIWSKKCPIPKTIPNPTFYYPIYSIPDFTKESENQIFLP